MQTYAIKMFNFLRFGETNNTIVFDLTEAEKEQIALGEIGMDDIYDYVVKNPVKHVKAKLAKTFRKGKKIELDIPITAATKKTDDYQTEMRE